MKTTYRVMMRTADGTITEAPLPFVLNPENVVPWTMALAEDYAYRSFAEEPAGTMLIVERRRGEGAWVRHRTYLTDGKRTMLRTDAV